MVERIAVLLVAALLGAGCAPPSAPERLRTYRERVDAILGRPTPAAPVTAGVLPRRRERVLPAGDHRIGVFDFLAVQRCGLGALAGERTSPLGQVMPPPHRLVHEHRVQVVGRACLPELDPERRAELAAVLEAKRLELPIHRWNAVWGAGELERVLSVAGGRAAGPPDDAAEALATLASALQAMDGGVETAQGVANALAGLRRVPPVGRLIRDLAAVASELAAVADGVETVETGPCRHERVALAHAFERLYVPVQTSLVELDRRSHDVLGALDAIHAATAPALGEARDPLADVAARTFSLGPEGLRARSRDAIRRHAAAWGPILRTCGVLPDPADAAPGQGAAAPGASSSGGNVTETGMGR